MNKIRFLDISVFEDGKCYDIWYYCKPCRSVKKRTNLRFIDGEFKGIRTDDIRYYATI